MAKSKKQNNKGATPNRKRAKARPRRGLNDSLTAYLRMLSDPCGADLAAAPYAGTGSSYLMRTTDIWQPALGTLTALDFVVDFTPWNYPTMLCGAQATPGGANTAANVTFSSFMASSVVRSYRPIAACVKWIPTGPISSRMGCIGMSYTPNKQLVVGSSYTPAQCIANCQKVATNGSVKHEARWLPSFGDERMGVKGESNISGCGSIQIVGRSIDAVAGSANGYLELTVVWEWEPDFGGTTGATPSTSRFTGHTLNSVLSRIRDVGKFVFGASDAVRAAYSYAAGGNYDHSASITY